MGDWISRVTSAKRHIDYKTNCTISSLHFAYGSIITVAQRPRTLLEDALKLKRYVKVIMNDLVAFLAQIKHSTVIYSLEDYWWSE